MKQHSHSTADNRSEATPGGDDSPAPPRLCLIVLAWNGARWIEPCLDSILSDPDLPAGVEISVVDNASSDETPDILARRFPQIEVHRNRKNLGVAGGANIGFRFAMEREAEFALLLNQDTKAGPGWLKALLDAAGRHPDFGVFSPVQFDYETDEIDRMFRGHYDPAQAEDPEAIAEVETMVGAAIMIRTSLFRKIGLYDPIYFCYGEEDDFCRRARYHGSKVGIVPQAAIRHWHTNLQVPSGAHRRGRRLRNAFLYELKDPEHGTMRRVGLYFRYEFLAKLFQACRKGEWSSVPHILWANLQILTLLPRILRNRSAERRGACHL